MRIEPNAVEPEPPVLPDVCGVVLAGGLSSRLGHDKAVLSFSDAPATSLLEKTAGLLRTVLGDVRIAGRVAEGHACIPDIVPGCGPLAGVVSALEAMPDKAVMVLSCDLPFMNAPILHNLLHMRSKRSAYTCMTAYQQKETGHIEALVAIYEPEALPLLRTSLDENKLKLSRVVPDNRRLLIPYDADASLPFFNINYPADLEVVRRMLSLIGGA